MFKKRKSRKQRRRIPTTLHGTTSAIERLESRLLLSVSQLQYHNDNSGTGQNQNETALTPSDVNSTQFGKLFSTSLDGQVYAQPLYDSGVNITAGPNPGVHDVIYVATENDSLYAIDAHSGAILWQRSFLGPGITPVPSADTQSASIGPVVGITATPIIDPNTNILYLVTWTKEIRSDGSHYVQKLYAINISNGADALGGPAVIADTLSSSYPNITTDTDVTAPGAPSVFGDGDGSIGGVVTYDARIQLIRPALTIVDEPVGGVTTPVIFLASSSDGDFGPYHGWVLGYSATDLSLVAVFCTTPNAEPGATPHNPANPLTFDDQGGIWQSGGQIASDSLGNLYPVVGNGAFGTTLTAGGFPADGNYGDAFLKLTWDPTSSPSSQNVNGYGLTASDYFVPSNQDTIDAADADVGDTGALILPATVGSAAHPNLLVGADKAGNFYLIDMDNMGKFNGQSNLNPSNSDASPNLIVQEWTGTPRVFGSLSFFDGMIFAGSDNSDMIAYPISDGVVNTATAITSPDSFTLRGATASISSNGGNNPIVWAIDYVGTNAAAGPGSSQLRAYLATNIHDELYTSAQALGNRDDLGLGVKFSVPTVDNGMVYVGTADALVAYGSLGLTVVTPAAAVNLGSLDQPTFDLSVLGGYPTGEAQLKYQWSQVSGPGQVSFSGNTDVNTSKSTIATFYVDGDYTLMVTITAPNGATTTSTVNVNVPLPALPVITGGVYDVTAFGAVGDDSTVNTSSIQAAINAAHAAGGGTVELPFVPASPNIYISGPLIMLSNVDLQVDPGVELQAIPYADWPDGDTIFIPFIQIWNDSNVEITGGGTIDGSGSGWWNAFNANNNIVRAWLLDFYNTNGILVQNITLQNSPEYNLQVADGDSDHNITINDVTILNPANSPNTDGIDVGGTQALIENCNISTGDDNVAVNGASQLASNITVENCVFGNGHGMSIGSFTGGGVDGLRVSNITFDGTTNGIRLKSGEGRGGLVQDISYSDITMVDVTNPIVVDTYYENGLNNFPTDPTADPGSPPDSLTPIFRDITINNLSSTSDVAGSDAGIIVGLPDEPVVNFQMNNVNITAPIGMEIIHVRDLSFDGNSSITAASGNDLVGILGSGVFTTPYDATIVENGYTEQDIGAPAVVGTSLYDPDPQDWTINGGGAGIGGTSDQFNFASSPLTGDGGVLAEVNSLSAGSPLAQAGVMIRESTAPDAAFADVVVTPSGGVQFQWRSSDGATVNSATTAAIAAPVWVKLIRLGDSYTGYYSTDGSTWVQIGTPQVVTMTAGDLSGLVVSSDDNTTFSTAVFANINQMTAPTIAQVAAASLSPVTGTTTGLSVLGADAAGESNLIYTWASDGPAPVTFSDNADNSASDTTATFTQAGNYIFTVTIQNPSGFTATDSVYVQVLQTATQVTVAAPAAADGNGPFNFTVAVLDQFNDLDFAYAGTLQFGSSDGSAVLPSPTSLVDGTGTFSATLFTGGSQTITASDTVNSGLAGVSSTILVSAAASYVVNAPSSAVAGSSYNISVEALDQFGMPAPDYSGTAIITSSDPQAILPATVVFSGGLANFFVNFSTGGPQSITVTDSSNSSITGSAGPITVAAASQFAFIGAPAQVTAGSPYNLLINALDQFGGFALNYSGTARLTSSDPLATFPSTIQFNNGIANVNVTFFTGGPQSLTVTAVLGTNTGSVSTVVAAGSHYAFIGAPAQLTAGSTYNLLINALDQFNAFALNYSGIAHISSTDPLAILPNTVQFHNGIANINVTLFTGGLQTITATDISNNTIIGSTTPIVAAGSHYTFIGAPAQLTAGSPYNLLINALDQFNAFAPNYSGIAHISSTDPLAVLPNTVQFNNGIANINVTLHAGGPQTITATDISNNTIIGSTSPIVAAAKTYQFNGSSFDIAGNQANYQISAIDQFSGFAPNYSGVAHLTSSDPLAILPNTVNFNNGVASFNATFFTAGPQTITATDISNPSITGTSSAITVAPAIATHIVVNAPATATSGVSFNFTITAEDTYGNTVTSDDDFVNLTTSDPMVPSLGSIQLINGTVTTSATLLTTGFQTITAVDQTNSSLMGTSAAIDVNLAVPTTTHFSVGAPSNAVAGSPVVFTVTALDASDSTVPGYSGTIQFTSSDPLAQLPANMTLSSGVGTFTAILFTGGPQTINASDAANPTITGSTSSIIVAAASHFSIGTPTNATAGSPTIFTVTALDQFNNIAPNYSGTIHFTSSDPLAQLPANAHLSNGVGTFTAILFTGGTQTITATDIANPTITTPSNGIIVAAASHFSIGTPTNATAGSPTVFTVTALDQFNNIAPNYSGTIHFTSSDPLAQLPANAMLSNGVGTFTAILFTGGTQTITATDIANPTITTQSNGIIVAAASHFSIGTPTNATAGSPTVFTVTALDQFNNIAPNYSGTIHFTSSDPQAQLPANATLSNGVGTFTAILFTSGSQTITTTDIANPTITTPSNSIVVSGLAASQFIITAPPTAVAGQPMNFTVAATDAFDNIATNYTGTVHFTDTGGAATLPANAHLTNGVGSFLVTFKADGIRTVTATDTHTATITGSTGSINVSAAAPSTISFSAQPTTSIAGAVIDGAASGIQVTLKDQFGNLADGTVVLSISTNAGGGTLSGTLAQPTVNGIATFSDISLNLIGTGYKLAATVSGLPAVTANSSAFNITAAAPVAVTFIQGPTDVVAGIKIAPSITVAVTDAFGNAVKGESVTLSIQSGPGGGALFGTETATTSAATGVATFANVSLHTAGAYTLTATDGALTSVASSSFNVLAAAASSIVFLSQPSTVSVGSPFSVTMELQDKYGNLTTSADGSTISMTLGTHPGGSVLGGTLSQTVAGGMAVFSDLTVNVAGNYKLKATDSAGFTVTSAVIAAA